MARLEAAAVVLRPGNEDPQDHWRRERFGNSEFANSISSGTESAFGRRRHGVRRIKPSFNATAQAGAKRRATTKPENPDPQTMKSYESFRLARSHCWFARTARANSSWVASDLAVAAEAEDMKSPPFDMGQRVAVSPPVKAPEGSAARLLKPGSALITDAPRTRSGRPHCEPRAWRRRSRYLQARCLA